jgi:hypothetical protein
MRRRATIPGRVAPTGRRLRRAIARAGVPALLLAAPMAAPLAAQAPADSTRRPVQEGIWDRPFIAEIGRTAVGGYVEGNSAYVVADGIAEGLSLELRRFNIFLFSTIGSRIRFLSELEFEHGTEEIAIETALVDVQVTPSLVLRAGILLPPLGAFNVNHDSPRWNFVDRPLVSTAIIPATLSEVGFGVHGRLAPRGLALTYDLYAVNGLGDGVLLNDEGRTSLAAGKGEERFGEDNNGSLAFTGRVGAQRRGLGEVGLSFYTGIYNRFVDEGERVDDPRRLTVLALDANASVGPVELRGEVAHAAVAIPSDLRDAFGRRQFGWHLDATMPVWRPRSRGFPGAYLSADLRLEHVDLNVGRFASTGAAIGDEISAIVLGASFHPASGTVFKANYRRERARDLFRNAPSRLGAFHLGVATYF